MNIFIVSNSSYFDTIALISIKYIINLDNIDFIVLYENHDDNEKVFINNKHIKICDNIEEAVILSDITILYSDSNFPKEKEEKIMNLCSEYNKKFNKIILPNDMFFSKDTINPRMKECYMPVIMSLAIGKYHYQYRTELIINDISKRMSIGFKQVFTGFSSYLIEQYTNILETSLFTMEEDNKVLVVAQSYHSFNDLLLDDSLYDKINLLNPSVIVVDIESSFDTLNDLTYLFKYKFNHEIDLYIRSDYAQVSSNIKGVSKPIYYTTEDNCLSNNTYIKYSDIYKNIYHVIMSKIAFPQGIKYINTL